MLDLNQLAVFIRVVDEGSFTAAGKALNVPKSRISRMVADLESNLGARLLQRSTRQISLTQVGGDYYNNCKHLVSEIMDVHTVIADRQDHPHGVLRISVPMLIGSGIFGRFVTRFQKIYPEVRIEIAHTDHQVNLIEEKFDLGLVLGKLPESSLVARTIAETESVICASPEYLAKLGALSSPADLAHLDVVKIGEGMLDETYEFFHETEENISVKVKPNIVTNHIAAGVNCIVQGAGIGVVPMFMAGEYILSGSMIPLFPAWKLKPEPISVVYPSRQYLSLKVRKFIDFLVDEVEYLKTAIEQLPTPEEQLAAYKKLAEEK
ncbi:MAG: LysR family transcriptional regulator [Oleispira antarctica]|nr:LysR family transcriptional regulator [Oleispira antarctica]MBQ0793945.1 LysR family transcriptional regulator [Oleispira antarctica]